MQFLACGTLRVGGGEQCGSLKVGGVDKEGWGRGQGEEGFRSLSTRVASR